MPEFAGTAISALILLLNRTYFLLLWKLFYFRGLIYETNRTGNSGSQP
jgi:hypothetical protein